MRTRFLGIDYFNSAPFQSIETLEFLSFPPPELPPSNLPNLEDIRCFDVVSTLNISPELENFPVGQALTKFFSDVIPQNINADLGDFADAPVSSRKCGFYMQKAQFIDDVRTSEEEAEAKDNFDILQFEMPELDLLLENACFPHEEKMQIIEIMDAEVSADVHNTTFGLEHFAKIQESVFSVDDINVECNAEEKSDVFEDGGSVRGHIETNCSTFPLLEVDETSLGILSYPSVKDLHIFESTAAQTLMQKDELIGDGQELLFSVKFDIFQHLLNHCLSLERLDHELSLANYVPEKDFINVIVDAETDGKSEFHRARQDETFILSMTPIVFEQFQFFDMKTSQFFEVFSNVATVAESESCEDMFNGTANFNKFDELIVSQELTLTDDSFKSLPVPIFPDHGKIWSLQAAMEEIIVVLKPQPSSTSDGIYLDWHLLEEDIWNLSKYRSFGKMFEEIDTYIIDSHMNSLENGMLFEFVFSDNFSTEPNTEENMEELKIEMNIASAEISTDHGCCNEIASSKLSKYRFQESVNGEVLFDINAKKTPQLVQSISQFNDLDFFLSPLDRTHRKDQKPAVKSLDNDASFPVALSRDSAAEFTTSEVQLQHCDIKLHPEGDPHSIPPLHKASQKLEELRTIVPSNKKYNMESPETAAEFKACSMPLPVPCVPSALESDKISASMPPSPDSIIIVNTLNVDGEMIISRRSTYQKILAMEKKGAQVVERDLNFPVDVIISAAICLVWYDSRNIRKKAMAPDEAALLLSSCVENIAANVLTSLSFTFSICILVFEGEVSFLSDIMELSDELYAAAASLGIELQLFCSYSSEITDEIIMNCIWNAAKLTRGLYPKMLESETLAESFLTKIPSVNPLSAHAILSSVGMLVEFFEWSHLHRLRALQKYPIPDESISLLSAFCRYGEREESKSGMTDCSSSVSSAPDSGNCYGKSESQKRKRKYIGNPDRISMPMDELLLSERSKQCNDDILNPPSTFKPYTSWMPKDLEISDELGKSSIDFDDRLFGQIQGSETRMATKPPRLSSSRDLEKLKAPKILQKIENPSFPSNHILFGQSKGLHMPTMKGLDWTSKYNCGSLQKDFTGEVVDIDDCSPAGKDSHFPPSIGFSPSAAEMEKEYVTRIFSVGKKSSFGTRSHPTFPTAAEISSGSESWVSERDCGKNLSEEIYEYPDVDLNNDNTPLKHKKMLLEEGQILNSAPSFPKPSFQEAVPHYRTTPLSNAVLSGQAQEGSPWTMEFLNRIREKSRLRQQTLPRELSGPCFGYSGNISKVRKRKSPSILDFYKYQRGSTPLQTVERKRQKQPVQPSSSCKVVKGLPPSLQTWTPEDKRARRRLSFATNGSQGQTKLVWIDKTAQTLNKRC